MLYDNKNLPAFQTEAGRQNVFTLFHGMLNDLNLKMMTHMSEEKTMEPKMFRAIKEYLEQHIEICKQMTNTIVIEEAYPNLPALKGNK